MKAPYPSPVQEWHNDTYPAIDPTRPELSAKGKKIIVTGGGNGIGRGVVEAFAIAGADHVAISGRRETVLVETKKYIESKYATKISIHVADVTDDAAMKKAAAEIGTWDADVSEWWKAFEINVKGALITTQAFIPTAGKGAVVVATSAGVVSLPGEFVSNTSAYAISKLALNKFIEVLATVAKDVSFTTIHPGIVKTDLAAKSEIEGVANDTVELPSHYTVWVSSPGAAFLRNKFTWCNWDVDELKAKAKSIEESNIFTTNIEGWPFSPEKL
ncbi:putative NADP(+)-dependent dehydrogenase [Tothia fuscella]|uniref:NADP(+)-dependent dehydrogenase n=1 Tax=Tothia fuscella TaxID=1048955 RepID=A0A9P4NQ03_9PEZI|nr:putative NADP(+)-dependent dehydrogenase [Tothia fuscella]